MPGASLFQSRRRILRGPWLHFFFPMMVFFRLTAGSQYTCICSSSTVSFGFYPIYFFLLASFFLCFFFFSLPFSSPPCLLFWFPPSFLSHALVGGVFYFLTKPISFYRRPMSTLPPVDSIPGLRFFYFRPYFEGELLVVALFVPSLEQVSKSA